MQVRWETEGKGKILTATLLIYCVNYKLSWGKRVEQLERVPKLAPANRPFVEGATVTKVYDVIAAAKKVHS